MNRKMVFHILGKILIVEAALMVPSVIVGLIYKEKATLAFLVPILALVLIGVLLSVRKPKNKEIYARDGFFIVASAWVLMSLFGALPFYLSRGYYEGCQFNSYVDCFFEVVSGFTTTGASVLTEIDILPRCILFWRCFTHWIGGMGVLVFVMAILPLSEERSLYLMRAESPGPIVGKLVPKMKDTARVLYGIYIVMTFLCFILLLIGKMPVYDALCHSFGAAGTGGFNVKTAGVGFYDSAYIEMVIAVFILLFGINFNLYYLILLGNIKEALKSEELRWYLGIVGLSTLTISLNIMKTFKGQSFRYAFFQVATIITTTGFSTTDFNTTFPELSKTVLVLLMLIGACAGSTGGGIKVSRLIILLKSFKKEIKKLMHPRSVTVIKLEGKPIDSSVSYNTIIYFVMYMVIMLVSLLLISVDNFDFTTNSTAVIACFNNIGPGLGAVGPVGSYGGFSAFSKLVLSFDMLFGRLEILPMLVLFTPKAWKKKA
ncbi:MAG: TrkH family potassium uptake protein [Clostridia bacterium]|nr:TrkH family potassium uptake protein [Clostridia bacterium]